MDNSLPWIEKYRPTEFVDIVGKLLIKKLKKIIFH